MYMCLSPSPFQKEDFTSGSNNQAFILAQLIVYLNCNFSFFLTTFKSVDAAEIWLVTVSSEFIHLYLHLCKETPFSGHLPSPTENWILSQRSTAYQFFSILLKTDFHLVSGSTIPSAATDRLSYSKLFRSWKRAVYLSRLAHPSA